MRKSTIQRWRHTGMVRFSIKALVIDAKHSVIVDSKVAVGRRRRHQADMRRRRPQGQRSPLWPQWAAAWPLVPRSRTSSVRRSAPSKLFQPYVMHMSHILVQQAFRGFRFFLFNEQWFAWLPSGASCLSCSPSGRVQMAVHPWALCSWARISC